MIGLRDVQDGDLEAFFEHWCDEEALEMAAFTPANATDRAAFEARWARLRGEPSVTARTIQLDGEPVGSISSWDNEGKREVTYWIGRAHWGKGIATEALQAFLAVERTRPLHAATAIDNVGSQRVLTKCGFRVVGEGRAFANARGKEVAEVLFRLDAPVAESFDRAAAQYERGRPEWPSEVVGVAALPRTASVVDLGAGTGKLTRLLVQHFAKVIAVEPLAGMRELLATLVPDAEAVAGVAEDIPVDDAVAEGVFCAEAFHWFDGERALAEVARVLRPGGSLVLMWNIQSGPTEPSIAAAAQIVNERGHSDRQIEKYESGAWRAAFENAPVEELQAATFDHVQTLDREGLLAHLLSMSWIAVLPADELDQLARDVRPLLTAERYRRPFRSEVYWTRRL